jgi:hypothetical protein
VVFVVWEPVLATDLVAPTSSDLARCREARARQYWDPDSRVSAAMPDAHGPRRSGVVWDYVALYAPGATWGGKLPRPAFEGGPVVEASAELGATLGKR